MNLADIEVSVRFWAWWSNPLIDMHEDQRYRLGLPIVDPHEIDYLSLLEIRSNLELDDTPDELLSYNPGLRGLAFAQAEEFQTRLMPFSYWLLDASVLNARPQDWEQAYGISSPDDIRHIISQRAALPASLMNWHGQLTRSLNLNLKGSLLLADRARACLLIYLRSFYPRLGKRWALTQSDAVIQASQLLEPLPSEQWEEFQKWAAPMLAVLNELFEQQVSMPEFNLDFEADTDDAELEQFVGDFGRGQYA